MNFARKLSRWAFLLQICSVIFLPPAPVSAGNLLIIGDSLSKEYAVEFAAIGGNLSASHVRNWCEILDARRNSDFNFGNYATRSDWRLTGHEYNWSVPGSLAEDWRSMLVTGSLGLSGLETQLTTRLAQRVVIWVGGNDIRAKYEGIYNGGESATWVNQISTDIEFMLDYVISKAPSAQIVLVPVLHIGCSTSKNAAHPYDVIKTGRVTAALDSINNLLRSTASLRRVGWAQEIYTISKELLTKSFWTVGGYKITKRDSSAGEPDAMFLGDGFHPNWPMQAVFAQIILDTFNAQYGTRITRLSSREIVGDVLGQNTDLALGNWATGYGLATVDRGSLDDPDGDKVSNLVEFALDMDPTRPDRSLLPQPYVARINGLDQFSLSWQPRDLGNATRARITPQESTDQVTWTDIPSTSVVSAANGLRTVRKNMKSSPRIYRRLKVEKLP